MEPSTSGGVVRARKVITGSQHPMAARYLLPCLGLFLFASAGYSASSEQRTDAAGFATIVRPFVEKHCVSCHGEKKQKGDLRLDTLANDFLDPATAEKWAHVVNTVNSREMP